MVSTEEFCAEESKESLGGVLHDTRKGADGVLENLLTAAIGADAKDPHSRASLN